MCFRTTLIIIGIITVVCAYPAYRHALSASSRPDPYSSHAIAAKNYLCATVKMVSHEKPILGEPLELHARQFEKLIHWSG